jgi:hypothetical protein
MEGTMVIILCLLFSMAVSPNDSTSMEDTCNRLGVLHFLASNGADTLFYATTPENGAVGEELGLASVFVARSHGNSRIVRVEEYEHYSRIEYWIDDFSNDGINDVVVIAEDEAMYSIWIYKSFWKKGRFEIKRAFKQDGLWLPDSLFVDARTGDTTKQNVNPYRVEKANGRTKLTFLASSEDDKHVLIDVVYDQKSDSFHIIRKRSQQKRIVVQ